MFLSRDGDNETSRQIKKFIARERDLLAYIDFQKRVNSMCRKLVTSLISLRSDMIAEMRHRSYNIFFFIIP